MSDRQRTVDDRLESALGDLWARGWCPADLRHVASRLLLPLHGHLAALRIAGQARRYGRGLLDPRWRQQAEASAPAPRLAGLTSPADVAVLLALVEGLPAVPAVLPAPGVRRGAAGTAGLDPRMSARVRALLAKAESTTFEQEAEALTAKAQQLIARHALDETLLHATDGPAEPSARRLYLDDPYLLPKATLVAAVAAANHARAIVTQGFGWVTVFGYDPDLDAVELLSASLTAQATAAMLRQGSWRDEAGRSRTRSFRRAFLLGFAQRIGRRLRETTDAQVAAADTAALVPLLTARDERVRAAADAAYPHVDRLGTSFSNGLGWSAGRAAADVAALDVTRARLER